MNHASPTRSSLLVLLGAVCTALAVGCMNRELVRVDPKTESYITEDVPVQDFVGVDVLVIVDNSGSMAAEQTLLSSAFPNLISSILNPPEDPENPGQRVHAPVRDLHIGVVSTDMGVGGYTGIETCGKDDPDYNPMIGDNGVLRNTPRGTSCDPNYPSFLSYSIEPTAEPNLTQVDKLSRDFGCIAVLGTGGCGFEQQLEAARKAILPPPEGHNGPGGANAGFIRDNTILTILFVSDEEDCSAADPTVFDVAELPYSINLQCFYQEPKLHNVDRYLQAFGTVRPDPENLVVGFIVGVPVNETKCNARGSRLGDCLSVPLMQDVVQPDGDLLEFSCKYPADCTPPDPGSHQPGNCRSEAFPARRYVELAQMMGDNAIVQSICQEDFVGAVAALTEKLKEAIKEKEFRRRLELEKDPANACRCLASCAFIEVLGTSEPCPAGKTPYDEDGDTVADVKIDESGQAHTLCEIPQAGIIIKGYKSDPGCSTPATLCDAACDDPCVTFEADTATNGWWYDPTTQKVDFSKIPPKQGSGVNIQCRSVVCPEGRQCGSTANLNAKCCDVNEYCYYPGGNKNTPGYCLVRKDVCEEYGEDVWCANVGPIAGDPNIGGLCCLDHDMDGNLERALEDVDGDTVGEVPGAPLFRCEPGTACVQR